MKDTNLHIVEFHGQFGFIKPWTAVRDSETNSQQFLTPSMVMGIERKLFPELMSADPIIHKILRHRISYSGMSTQQEVILPRGWNRNKKTLIRKRAVLKRGVLLNPRLFLAFSNADDAYRAARQHICLARNEDILFPVSVQEVSEKEFDTNKERFGGFELIFERNEFSFLVGYNRYRSAEPMYGWLKIIGGIERNF